MRHLRKSALLAAIMIGSAAFAASVSADTSTASDHRRHEVSFSGSSCDDTSISGIAGRWEGNLRMEISELLTGTFRLEDCESDTNGSYSGSLVATDNGDSTYLVTLADVLSGVSDTATLTLSGNELIGSFDLGDGMIEVKTVRGCTLAGARDNSESDTDMAGREQPIPTGSVSEKQTEREKRDGVELQTSIETKKPTITKALRAKLDKRLGAIDESERETIYRMLIEKLDTAIAKTTNTTKQQTYSEVREYIQSRLESEFSQSSEGDGKILDSIFSESSHQDD